MKKKKAWIFLVITLLVLLYVFVEAPTLSPLYLDGAIFWAVLITIYVGLNALMKIAKKPSYRFSLPMRFQFIKRRA